jgi:hypothetical protein
MTVFGIVGVTLCFLVGLLNFVCAVAGVVLGDAVMAGSGVAFGGLMAAFGWMVWEAER